MKTAMSGRFFFLRDTTATSTVRLIRLIFQCLCLLWQYINKTFAKFMKYSASQAPPTHVTRHSCLSFGAIKGHSSGRVTAHIFQICTPGKDRCIIVCNPIRNLADSRWSLSLCVVNGSRTQLAALHCEIQRVNIRLIEAICLWWVWFMQLE
jgi:hypothetical protein